MPRTRFPVTRLQAAAVSSLCAVFCCAGVPVASTQAAATTTVAAASAPPLQLTLPAPTGQDRLGVVSLHLIDHARTDPWVPGRQVRQLMISIWYPARDTAGYPLVPWLAPAAASHFAQTEHLPPGLIELPVTDGHAGAPVDRQAGGRPVVLFSPGSGEDRGIDTALVEDLASHGYIVVTIDATHDSGEVEFPDGQVALRTLPPDSDQVNTEATAVRVADTRFVLDQLAAIAAGHDPDAEHLPLPSGLAGALNLSEVGMFGHSIGGATTANAMLADPRIKVGIDLDGTIWGPVAGQGLSRPFLLMSAQDNGRDVDPTWARFWSHLRGWRLDLRLTGAEHLSFTDAVTLYQQAAPVLGLTAAQLAQLVGTVNGDRAIAIERAYVRAFFDLELRHRDTGLLDRPSPAYPEVQFIP
jgi:Platelet-activating factor acetylhydrolase, isoform II